VVSETPYAEIWGNLRLEWGASFSDVVKTAHTPGLSVKLQSCSQCGLQYFSPAVSGTEQFYSELTSASPHYYDDAKWEFDYVRPFLQQDHRALDVACGKGAFLRSISGSVSEAVGVDTNPDAISRGNDSQFRIFNQSVEEFSTKHCDYFDFVSAFQVIEHLSCVLPFVRAAYRCVKPGGILVLSVPNRERRKDLSFGSLDYPPHHISRWHENQLALVAQELDGTILTVAKEPLNKSQTIGALRIKELPELIPFPFYGRNTLFKILSRLALTYPMSLAWRKQDMNARLGMFGLSLLIVIQKPMAERCAV
jgi:SAM-dependent methyltransferase